MATIPRVIIKVIATATGIPAKQARLAAPRLESIGVLYLLCFANKSFIFFC